MGAAFILNANLQITNWRVNPTNPKRNFFQLAPNIID